ncbi:ABC transporter permease [Pararhodobacter sp. CCB-MM2]|uniref:ABC transporter permease n=1 Tax=Pararhodobacter sp. CCB-MM2 TaxID=1786003 RepID=UPI000AB3B9F6|nr:ABC transporter permease [Pararhodobacter sp. CCB-MM2]
MRALNRKLMRDLRRLWAQAFAIAAVLACGIMMLVGMQMTQATLSGTQAAYYDRYRFADVFAAMTRAPRSVVAEAARIEGVALAEGRIGFQAVLDIEGLTQPATGRVVSLPEGGAQLNLPLLRRGRMPERTGEVAVNEPFGEANGLLPGSRFRALLNGRLQELTVTGWVLSPEFVYTIAPGAMMPDDRRYGVLWLPEPAAEAAMDMGGAINEIALRLTREADERAVIEALDDLLDPYGGTGAYGRDRQQSHAFLDGEMQQLGVLARFLPPVFLLVAMFLVNMVLGRLIKLERTQIGLLKAIGYSTQTIAAHYLKLAMLIGLIGAGLGVALGQWMGSGMIASYRDYFRFPVYLRDPATGVMVLAAALGMATALIGGAGAVRASVLLPPAEAMSPPAPPAFSRGWLDWAVGAFHLRQTTMMILRSILRWPGRAAITLFGVTASVALLVASYFMFDAVDLMADTLFTRGNRQTVTLVLASSQPESAVQDALSLPGVRQAEGAYSLPVRLVLGHRSRLSAVTAHVEGETLSRLLDDNGDAVALPSEGLVLPERLAEALGARIGDLLRIEMLAPPREVLELPVAAVIAQGMGQEAHLRAEALFAAMRIVPQVNRIHLLADPARRADLDAAIKETPAIAGLTDWSETRAQFDATLRENMSVMLTIQTLVGLMTALGVVYNAARIQVSERSHELASLRVLGFSRWEVGYVLVGEIMLLTLIAIPMGWLAGYGLAAGLVQAMATDLVAIPFTITRRTYALAALAVFAASLGAVLLVRRRLDRVELATALKARE